MVEIRGAAAYVPRSTDGDRRVGDPDEDEFTMLATAIERLEDGIEPLGGIGPVVVVGTIAFGAADNVARFLGSPSPIECVGRGPEAFSAALEKLSSGVSAHESALLLAVDRDPGTTGDPGDRGLSHAAIAIWLGGGGANPVATDAFRSAAPSSTGPAFAWAASTAAARVPRWGDWRYDGRAGTRSLPAPAASAPGGATVSQGAYVPWPRYLEATNAHWRLIAAECGACGALTFPPRGRCRACESTDPGRSVRLARDGGRVIASTRIGAGGQPTEFDEQVTAYGPYSVVLVEFAAGVRATLPVALGSGDPPAIGGTVTTRLRRRYPIDGEWRYGRKALVPDPPARGTEGS
ncbi:MAG TPA: zinc ribbon domain-containing protein [Thermoplasmata archaeon]|nr:zinc ribbon domain-containing protein [Thermoplasmata archaeon]